MTVYDEYATLEAQIKVLENKKDELRGLILNEMIEKGTEKFETALGKFSAIKLKRWEYPKKVITLGEDFKEAKAKAESTGEATYTESDSLRFSAVKL